jgi:hypothetical protein
VSHPLPRRTVTFVVRLWAEYLEWTPPAWRGEIEHVGSGQVNRFGDVSTMLEFIEGFARKPRGGKGGDVHRDSVSNRSNPDPQ